jgi:hypothetical protein
MDGWVGGGGLTCEHDLFGHTTQRPPPSTTARGDAYFPIRRFLPVGCLWNRRRPALRP